MAEELRPTGISIVGDVPWGTHFCYFYKTKQDLLDILVPYFKTGLESREFCLWIISNSELIKSEDAKRALGEAVSDLDRYLAEGRIEIVPHDQWFLQGGAFDFHRVANGFKEKLDEALARGYVGMRVNGSPAWIQTRDTEELREFEAEVDHLFPNQRIIASCTYPLNGSRADFLLDVARNHQFTIARRHGSWDVLGTPELMQAKQEIQRLNEELEQRVIERTRELAAANEELKKEIAERQRAEEELKATSEQLRKLSARLQSAIEEERTRIARELHDELGSALAVLKWGLEEIKALSIAMPTAEIENAREKLTTLTALIDTTFAAVRRISSELRPGLLDEAGLVAAIEWAAKQFEERTGIVCRFESSVENPHLSREQSTAVFRISQEALTNILRHAEATRVEITMNEEGGQFVLTISDNGRGITAQQQSGTETLGIIGMRERAHLMRGEVSITRAEGGGTVVTVRVPIAG